MGRRIGLSIAVLSIMAALSAKAGPKLEISEDAWLQPAFLGQVHYRFEDNVADKDDFFLRRGRIILMGQAADGIKFFMETDNDNAGKNGMGSVSTDIQDAFLDVRLLKNDLAETWISGGLILLPFSFENKASAAKLLGIDYNAETVKFVNSFVWRDYGAELHGFVGKKVQYHAGVFDGYDQYATATLQKNPDAALRYTGHASVNILGDAETGWFYTQERLQEGNYLAIGAGYNGQEDATLTIPASNETAVVEDSSAWVIDLQSGFDLGAVDITLNAAYYDWDNAAFDGNTAFVESGVKIDKVEVTGKWTMVDPKSGSETTDYTAGANYFLKGHNARVGVEYRWGDSNDLVLGGLQVLL